MRVQVPQGQENACASAMGARKRVRECHGGVRNACECHTCAGCVNTGMGSASVQAQHARAMLVSVAAILVPTRGHTCEAVGTGVRTHEHTFEGFAAMWPPREHLHDGKEGSVSTRTHTQHTHTHVCVGFCAKAHGAHVSCGRGSAWPQREMLATCSFEMSCHEPFGDDDFLVP